MIKKDERFNQIKSLIKSYFKEEKFQDIPAKDGSKLCIADTDELATGVAIFVVDDNGNQTPAPDGTVELADGRSIVIKGGLVDSISENPMEPTSDSPQNDANVSDPAQVNNDAATDGAVSGGPEADVNSRLDALESQVGQILEILQGMNNTQETAMSALTDNSPAVNSIKDEPLLDEVKEVLLSRHNSKVSGSKRELLMNIKSKASEFQTLRGVVNPKTANGANKKLVDVKENKRFSAVEEVVSTEPVVEREKISLSNAKQRAFDNKTLGKA